MNLCYTLPDQERLALDSGIQNKEKIIYCIPFDLNGDGDLINDGWFVVTRSDWAVIQDGKVTARSKLDAYAAYECIKMDHCGVLTAKSDGGEQLLIRFSMTHLARFSYVAKGMKNLLIGQQTPVKSKERELFCPVCGRALPGTSVCPRCSGNGRFTRRLWDMAAPYTMRLITVTLLMLATTALSIYQAQFQRRFIDRVLIPGTGTGKDILWFSIGMFLLLLGALICTIVRNRWSTLLGSKISADLRYKIYAKIQALSLSFIDKRTAGALMNRIMGDTWRIREFIEQVFSGLISQLVTMIAVFLFMLVINWKLTLLALTFVPVVLIVSRKIRRRIHRLYHRQWRFDDQANARLQDTLSGIRVVKSFGTEQYEIDRFNEINQKFAAIQMKNEKFWAAFFPLITFSVGAGGYLITYFGGLNVLSGAMTIGQLTQFLAYSAMLYAPLQRISFLPRILAHTVTSMERIYDVLEEESDVSIAKNGKSFAVAGHVQFDNVTFGYESYDPVLEEVSLDIRPGEMIGLVGSSGAGKSTLINLIMHLYDPDEGCVKIDGTDVRDINPQCLYSQIGVVLQETFLFSGTILENLCFSKPDATMEEVIGAAKMGGAHDFICKLPDGYNTYLGEGGNTLSGGEKQRVAIARAVLGDPKILILDEATSSLDTETEYQIQQALARLIRGRTTFAIAHRLSTLRGADRIVVIDKKRTAEIGSHEELLKQRGIYYNLVTAQIEMKKVAGE